MNALWSLINLLVFIQIVTCRDFYVGMFRRNDFLVAQDVVYKAPEPFGYTTASYGRLFKCPITYFRVVDRLGMGRGPITSIVRGGLRKKFIAVRIKSTYRLPISVNIYVGCENKKPSTFRTTIKLATHSTTEKSAGKSDNDATTISKATDFSAATATEENKAAPTNDSPSVAPEGPEKASSDIEPTEAKTEEESTGETNTGGTAAEEPPAEETTAEEPAAEDPAS